MKQARVPYKKILFVCVNERQPHEACCARQDSQAIAEALKARVKALGLSGLVRVSKSGCQDLCAKGPNVMLFPDYMCYHAVTRSDVERIIESAVKNLASPARPPASSA